MTHLRLILRLIRYHLTEANGRVWLPTPFLFGTHGTHPFLACLPHASEVSRPGIGRFSRPDRAFWTYRCMRRVHAHVGRHWLVTSGRSGTGMRTDLGEQCYAVRWEENKTPRSGGWEAISYKERRCWEPLQPSNETSTSLTPRPILSEEHSTNKT